MLVRPTTRDNASRCIGRAANARNRRVGFPRTALRSRFRHTPARILTAAESDSMRQRRCSFFLRGVLVEPGCEVNTHVADASGEDHPRFHLHGSATNRNSDRTDAEPRTIRGEAEGTGNIVLRGAYFIPGRRSWRGSSHAPVRGRVYVL